MESPLIILLIAFAVIIALLASGMWISIALGWAGVIVILLFEGGGLLRALGMMQFNMVNSFIFTALPLFVFMGELILSSGLSVRLYKGATSLVGFLPGGLLHTNIVACSIFAAVSGSSVATAATIGTVAVPELEKKGYNMKLLTGSLAAGGTLGILIPPSMIMIIYGAMVGESVGQLFMAGVFPGLLLTGLFMSYIGGVSVLHPRLIPERLKFSFKSAALGLMDMWPILVLVFMVLGSIYLGVATPTEAAALGASGAMVFAAFYKKLTWRVLKKAALGAIEITSWAMLIVVCANILGMGLAKLQVPRELAEIVVNLPVSPLVILALIVLFYVILGMFMEAMSMMILTLPVVYPVMMVLGFNSVWFGVIMVVFIEMAQITPPVGVNIYVIHGITGKKYLHDIIIGVIPFVLCQIAVIVILTAFPKLALWLPGKMIRRF